MSTLTLLRAMPPQDADEFATWPDDCRREVRGLISALAAIDDARGAYAAVAAAAARLGLSVQRVRTIRTEWTNGVTKCGRHFEAGDWRLLINRAKYAPVTRKLPGSFVDFWKELLGTFQRDQTGRSAHDALLARLRAWEAGDETQRIPGYRIPPPRDTFTGVPAGWTYENLMRHKPTIYQSRAMRQGLAAAAEFRLPVLTTRVGLRVGQVLQFDDQHYDLFVNFIGVNRRQLRPLGLDCMDVASAAYFANSYKPSLVEYDPGTGQEKRAMLKEADMLWFVAHVLCTRGYRTDTGTVLTVEHGTAAIARGLEEPAFSERPAAR